MPLCFRICELVLFIIPCLLPAWAIITFPLEEILNLFFAELFVFNFGIIFEGYTKLIFILQLDLFIIEVLLPIGGSYY